MAHSWDEVATRLVVERGDALSRYADLLTGSGDDAADLVQDALVHTFGTPRFGLTLPRAEAYVRRAILNAVIDRSRRDGTWRKVRHLAVWKEWPVARWLHTGAAEQRVVDALRASRPLTDWLDTHVGPATAALR